MSEFKFDLNLVRLTGTLHEGILFFNDISEFFLEWEMFLDRSCRENSNCPFICIDFFLEIVPFMVECEKNKKCIVMIPLQQSLMEMCHSATLHVHSIS